MYHCFLIHSFTDGHLGCFQHLAIVNCAAMNIGVHRFFWVGVSGFLGYNPNSGIAGSKGSYIFIFLRKFYNVFYSGILTNSVLEFPFLYIPNHSLKRRHEGYQLKENPIESIWTNLFSCWSLDLSILPLSPLTWPTAKLHLSFKTYLKITSPGKICLIFPKGLHSSLWHFYPPSTLSLTFCLYRPSLSPEDPNYNLLKDVDFSQDGGTNRYILLPCTTKWRMTTNL